MKSPSRPSLQLLRLQAHASVMRYQSTASERALWLRLKGRQLCGVQFRRQVPVGGKYIADFFASSAQVAVEVDGGYHAQRATADARRDRRLNRAGIRVVRLPAALVLTDIEQALALVRAALR